MGKTRQVWAQYQALSDDQQSRLIEMAWEDRTPFDAIHRELGFNEPDVIEVMKRSMKPSSFRMWRKRVSGRKTKHEARRSDSVIRSHSPLQYKHR